MDLIIKNILALGFVFFLFFLYGIYALYGAIKEEIKDRESGL
jgi:hypothetical protein